MVVFGGILIALIIMLAIVGVIVTLFKGATKPQEPLDEKPRDESLPVPPSSQRNLRGIDRG